MKITLRVWILIIVLILSLLVISPSFKKGVIIKSVEKNSSAYEEGLRSGMIIKSINGENINNIEDYSRIINSIFQNISKKENLSLTESYSNHKNIYSENKIKNKTNNTDNETFFDNSFENKIKLTITTENSEFVLFTEEPPKITVDNVPRSKIKTGLDLSGGARALVKADKPLSITELNELIDVVSNRINEFGISDVNIRAVSDLSGNNYMLIEIAGVTPSDLEDLVSKQGKFEAKIGNQTVFIGGQQDITYVAKTGEQSGIYSCNSYEGKEICSFRFLITLSEKAAKRQAEITKNLSIDPQNPQYLSKKLDLFLDDQLVDSLFISKNLKGIDTTEISIQGSGTGTTRQEAYDDALKNMKKLQTILITGSLPYKLQIIKIDTISPTLGREFLKNILLIASIVFIIISLVLFLKYRKIKITLAVILTMFSEAFITLAVAALIKWNLDAPSIAGIIAGMGTGVNDQIVILDEAALNRKITLKERIKNALFVIFGAFFTIISAMLPLFWAGAGLLKGFALTTIIGVCVGIFITRPAFADIIQNIIKD